MKVSSKKSELFRINADSTVQEKSTHDPTNVRLYDRLREGLVKSARKNEIQLQKTHEREEKGLCHPSSYAEVNRFRRREKR